MLHLGQDSSGQVNMTFVGQVHQVKQNITHLLPQVLLLLGCQFCANQQKLIFFFFFQFLIVCSVFRDCHWQLRLSAPVGDQGTIHARKIEELCIVETDL